MRLKARDPSAVLKDKIQSTLRKIVMIRDGGCILRSVYGIPRCNGYKEDGSLILQADHLITRSNSATYADSRLVVCLCQGHHGWKSVGNNLRKAQYDEIVKKILPPERTALWEKCERDSWRPSRKGAHDWKLDLVALEQEYRQLCTPACRLIPNTKDNSNILGNSLCMSKKKEKSESVGRSKLTDEQKKERAREANKRWRDRQKTKKDHEE